MDYAAYDSLWKELRAIMVPESLELVYEPLPRTSLNLEEREYMASDPLKIFISDLYAGNDGNLPNNEPIVVAHELGHYFDWKHEHDPMVAIEEREKRANDYMMMICDKHGFSYYTWGRGGGSSAPCPRSREHTYPS